MKDETERFKIEKGSGPNSPLSSKSPLILFSFLLLLPCLTSKCVSALHTLAQTLTNVPFFLFLVMFACKRILLNIEGRQKKKTQKKTEPSNKQKKLKHQIREVGI